VVLGVPASDANDELGLRLLQPLLGGTGYRFEVLTADVLATEVLERVGKDRPAVVCIADLPPVGLSNTRYLCKRLKAQYPELKVVVGRWGQADNLERVRSRLLAAGADIVTTSLAETKARVQPLVQVACANKRPPRKPTAPGATGR
jgi:hypothetical protein